VALLAANFGRNKNDEAKQRKVAVEYVKLRGQKQGRPEKSSQLEKIKLPQSQIAAELNMSVAELNRILTIHKKLTPEIIGMLDNGFFSKATALGVLVKLSQSEQEELITTFGDEIIKGVTQKQMQEYVNRTIQPLVFVSILFIQL